MKVRFTPRAYRLGFALVLSAAALFGYFFPYVYVQ